MFFQRIFTPGLAINSFLLGDEKTKRCAVIDPTRHVVPYIIQSQNGGFEITDILETHVHADFVSGAKELKHQLNEKPLIYASGLGGRERIPAYADIIIEKNGFAVTLGELRLVAFHTPGHTPEHLMWICFDDSRSQETPWFSFSGDCLFVGSVGRPDLLGKGKTDQQAHELYRTLFERLSSLPDFLEIFPSHGQGSLCGKALNTRWSSTLGYERQFNPSLKKEEENLWVKKIEEEQLPAPPYFERVKQNNLKGPPLLSTLKATDWKQGKERPGLDQLFLLDIRHPETYAASHLKNSINIPLSHIFTHWVGWMVPEKKEIGLIIDNRHILSEAIDLLRLMGYDQPIWIINYQSDLAWEHITFPMMDPSDLEKQKNSICIIDVRTNEEWNEGHIEEARHIQIPELESSLKELPREMPLALICRSGQRASLAASFLEKQGFSKVLNVRGGMQAWVAAGFPIEEMREQ